MRAGIVVLILAALGINIYFLRLFMDGRQLRSRGRSATNKLRCKDG